jgi:hypothetical protein
MPATACHKSSITLGPGERIFLLGNEYSMYTLHMIASLYHSPGLYVINSALSFALVAKFLGHLDRKVTWTCHLLWLCVKYGRSLSILKALCDRSWGEDWLVILTTLP